MRQLARESRSLAKEYGQTDTDSPTQLRWCYVEWRWRWP
jgi:hypothetical protein